LQINCNIDISNSTSTDKLSQEKSKQEIAWSLPCRTADKGKERIIQTANNKCGLNTP
jgi:hypothetical protein